MKKEQRLRDRLKKRDDKARQELVKRKVMEEVKDCLEAQPFFL
jgi:hypothetical protein